MHSIRLGSVLPDAGGEPYRAVGVDVNEAEILDVAARAQVSKAQDQYSKMYREVLSTLHGACIALQLKTKHFCQRPPGTNLFFNAVTPVGKFSTSHMELLRIVHT